MVTSAERIAPAGRLVLVTQTYFPAIDGTAVLIQHLAKQFAVGGNEVHVLTTDALGPAGFRIWQLSARELRPLRISRGTCASASNSFVAEQGGIRSVQA